MVNSVILEDLKMVLDTAIKISKKFKNLLKEQMKKDQTYEDFIKIRFEDLLKKDMGAKI